MKHGQLKKLAQKAGVSHSYLCQYLKPEKYRINPSLAFLRQVSEASGLTLIDWAEPGPGLLNKLEKLDLK